MFNWFRNIFNKVSAIFDTISSTELVLDSIEPDSKTGKLKIFVRFNYKSTAPIQQDPYDFFLENSRHISKLLSQDDFKRVLDIILENQKNSLSKKYKKKYVLIKHLCAPETEKILIVYRDIWTEELYVKSAQDIFNNRGFLKHFSAEDAACIGNLAANDLRFLSVESSNLSEKNNVLKFNKVFLSV